MTARNLYDVVIIGSGFGGSVSAFRLAEKGYNVAVVEAGKRWDTDSFPKTNWHAWKSLWFPKLGMRGIQRISLLPDIMILSGTGVGGGSLVYANTLYEPPEPFYTDDQWADITDWKTEASSETDCVRSVDKRIASCSMESISCSTSAYFFFPVVRRATINTRAAAILAA